MLISHLTKVSLSEVEIEAQDILYPIRIYLEEGFTISLSEKEASGLASKIGYALQELEIQRKANP